MKKLGMNSFALLLVISFLLFGTQPVSAIDPYADAVVSVVGTFGHCCGDLSNDPAVAASLVLGPPDAPPKTNFIQLSNDSSITLAFVDNVALSDGSTSGADLRIHTYDQPYPSAAKIEVSADGVTFYNLTPPPLNDMGRTCLGDPSQFCNYDDNASGYIDLDFDHVGLSLVRYVRITDLDSSIDGESTYPTLGFDLNAIEALNSGPPVCVKPPEGLVSWWPGDGNVFDIQDSNDGALMNGATFLAGKVGQAFSFDGNNDYVLIGNPPSLQLTQSVTIDAWVFYSNDLAEGQVASIAGKWGITVPTDSYVLSSIKQSGVIKLAMGIGDGTTPDPGLLGGVIPVNTWTHVAGTYNGATGENIIYVNGTPVASRTRTGGIFNSSINVLIGAQNASGGVTRFFPGLIDEVEIFDQALTEAEIRGIFYAGSTGKCRTCAIPPLDNRLIGWWPGDGNANDIVDDNNGTPQNGATFAGGKVGQAFLFDGVDDFVQISDNSNLHIQELTIDAWVNFEGTASKSQYFLRKWLSSDGGWGSFAGFRLNDDRIGFTVQNLSLGAYPGWSSQTALTPGWHHVAFTWKPLGSFDQNDGKIYIDGNEVITTFASNGYKSGFSIQYGSLPLYFGKKLNVDWAEAYKGKLDEVEIFNRALTPAEIRAIVNAGNAGKCRVGRVEACKFYDLDTDGSLGGSEPFLIGWPITISPLDNALPAQTTQSTGSSGCVTWTNLTPGLYTIAEGTPTQNNWVHTNASSLEANVSIGKGTTVDFGNVCLGAGGGHSLGFWSNKNGQALINANPGYLTALGDLNLVDGAGNAFDPGTAEGLRTWLLGANATNMAYMLSAQLAAMKLNVFNGFVTGTSLVYAGPSPEGCTVPVNPAGFISVDALINEADAELLADGDTPAGDSNRICQEFKKNALDAANNNLNFVQQNPCPATFPSP